jgi:type IV pilus assembly protein PilB
MEESSRQTTISEIPNAPAPLPAPTAGAASKAASQIMGELMVKAGLLTAEQLRHARRIQDRLPAARTLLSILEELKYVSIGDVQAALAHNRLDVPLGTILVEFGYIREAELNQALAKQKEVPGSRLGTLLVESRVLSEDDLISALSLQLGFERIDLSGGIPGSDLMRTAPAGWFRSNDLVPFSRREDGRVVVAFADPLNQENVETARRVFGKDIIIGIARRADIRTALDHYENGKKPVAGVSNDSAAVTALNQVFKDAIESGVSDIHMEPQKGKLRIRFRKDGVLIHYKDLPADLAPPLTSRIKILAKADIAEKRRHQDGRIYHEYNGTVLDIRVSTYVTLHGETIVMRILNNRSALLDIKELGMAPKVLQHFIEDALDAPSGVVITTGPTGSGKTTTLYASINYLNRPSTSIITAEDPVEYVIEGISQCSINPKINVTYEDTLKHIVRQDPDVIVIGEIRDLFSAETAIQAALTGHKVLTTFHTEDSIGGLLRLLNMNIEAFLISSTVVSVVAQRLVRRICPHCAEDQPLTPYQARRLGYDARDLQSFKFGRGCSRCRFTGYLGRVAIFELLVLNEEVKDALIARKTSYEIRRISVESTGLVTLLEDAVYKGLQGLVTFDEIIRMVPRLNKPRPVHEIHRLLGGTA